MKYLQKNRLKALKKLVEAQGDAAFFTGLKNRVGCWVGLRDKGYVEKVGDDQFTQTGEPKRWFVTDKGRGFLAANMAELSPEPVAVAKSVNIVPPRERGAFEPLRFSDCGWLKDPARFQGRYVPTQIRGMGNVLSRENP